MYALPNLNYGDMDEARGYHCRVGKRWHNRSD